MEEKSKSIGWSLGWDNVDWNLYARIYKIKTDNDEQILRMNLPLLSKFLKIRYESKREH